MSNFHDKDILVTIDFETLDTTPNAEVLTIGATAFKPNVLSSWIELEQTSFYAEFKPQHKRGISVDTIQWWMQQSATAQHAAFQGSNKQFSYEVLTSFNYWLKQIKATHLIGNGANFDNPILESLYKECRVKPAIPYWANLDLRTMRWLNPGKLLEWPHDKIQHHAKHDAIFEAMSFQHYYYNLITINLRKTNVTTKKSKI